MNFVTTVSESEGLRRSNGNVRSLPLDLWPEADRNAWNAACQPDARLQRGGLAGHLKPVTRQVHERHYGNFLGCLDRNGLLRREAPAAANVTPESVDVYLAEAKARMSSTTVYVSICCVGRAARYMVPGLELDWLAELAKDLALLAQPRSKFDRLVLPERLIEAGLTLIQEAEHSQTMTKLAQATQVRNGLMVALLAFCPIRRKNFAALEIGRSFVEIHGTWWIVLSASETKENRPDERPINELLTPVIDRYLGQYRSVLARTDNPPPALWLSSNDGAPISDKQVAGVIRRTTLATVGIEVSPHMFRTSGASAAATHGGENPYLASALLHHTHPSVTNAHYNRATSLSAAESLRLIVRQYVKK
jgi:integrase